MSSPPAQQAYDPQGNGRLGCNAPGREGRSEPGRPAHQKVATHDPYNMGCNGQTARLPATQTPQSAPRQSLGVDLMFEKEKRSL